MAPVVHLFAGCEPPPGLAAFAPRLERFTVESIRELDSHTAHRVHLVELDRIEPSVWNTLRVRLASANRWFIACGTAGDSSAVVRAMRDGAFDFVYTDEPAERWQQAIGKAVESQRLWLQLYGGRPASPEQLLVGKSEVMQSLLHTIQRVGPTSANVLIVGESGTGKERIAEALHAVSGLGGPLVPVNCAAIPPDLIESELFGSEKGAFTGALQGRAGLVEQAAGGTLFLDEIGEMATALQPKLLRFLESRRARRVGGRAEYQVEARIVAATNRDLRTEIEHESFRADLFYRLSEVELLAPALRDHLEDLPLLASHFVDEANEKFGKHFVSLDPALLHGMMQHTWPGNARELRATLHRLIIMHDGPVLRREWWHPPAPREQGSASRQLGSALPGTPVPPAPEPALAGGGQSTLNRRQKWERARELLASSGNDRTWTAAQLGIHPATLFRWQKSGKV